MKSIRNKLFLQMGLMVVFLVLLFMAAYTLFFEDVYLAITKNRLLNHYEYVNEMVNGNYKDIDKTLDQYDNGFIIDTFIKDSNDILIYQTTDYLFDKEILERMEILPIYSAELPDFYQITSTEKINENAEFVFARDVLLNVNTINVFATLDNGDQLITRARLMPINMNIIGVNRFAPAVGVALLFIGIVISYVLSSSFSKPLINMLKVTRKMSKQDFSQLCDIRSHDEIGALAKEINSLSVSLDKVIKTLNLRNKELEDEITENERLHEKRRQMLSNVSHELKTPLTMLQSYAEGLKKGVAMSHGKMDYYCDVILDETLKMNTLVSNLLDLDRLTFSETPESHDRIDLNEYFHHNIEKYKDQIIKNGLEITVDAPSSCVILTDNKRFNTIMTNYLRNAIKYVIEPKKIKVTIIDMDKAYRVEIYNTSHPIPEDALPKLWDDFYKVDTSRSRIIEGHGLGLSIVKAIQEADKNLYGVRNEEKGVVFWADFKKP